MSETPVPPSVPPVPSAPRVPVARELHGQTETDDYAWMRDRPEPEFSEYLAAERSYYDAHAARLAGLAGRLAAESAGRIPAGSEDSVGWPLSGLIYRTRTPEGRENLQFLRSAPGESGEQVLLDDNIVGEATGYVEVADRLPSPGGDLLAWSADTSGAEIYQLRIRDTATGADLPDEINRACPGLAWSADARYLFYLVPDELYRPFQLWRHQLGASAADDVLLYTEADAKYDITLRGSRSGQFAIITSACRDTTEVRLIPLADPLAEPLVVRPRQRGLEYRVDHARGAGVTGGGEAGSNDPAAVSPRGGESAAGQPVQAGDLGSLFIVTDDGEPEFTLKRAAAGTGGAGAWEAVDCAAVAPARADTRLLSCDVVGDRLLLTLRRGGCLLLAITDLNGQHVIEVPAGSRPAR